MDGIIVLCGSMVGVSVLITLALSIWSKRFFKTLLLSVSLGLLGLLAVNLTGRYTGVTLPVNGYTCGTAAALGVPGVCGLLILGMILGTG